MSSTDDTKVWRWGAENLKKNNQKHLTFHLVLPPESHIYCVYVYIGHTWTVSDSAYTHSRMECHIENVQLEEATLCRRLCLCLSFAESCDCAQGFSAPAPSRDGGGWKEPLTPPSPLSQSIHQQVGFSSWKPSPRSSTSARRTTDLGAAWGRTLHLGWGVSIEFQ